MPIFNKKDAVSRSELRSALRRDSGRIRGGEGKFSVSEREKMSNDIFGPKYGGEISKLDFKRAIRDLENQRGRTKDTGKKEMIDDKIKYLKQMGGRGF